MDASHSGTDKLTRGLARPAIMGAVVGAVAAVAMAMYAMIAAATYQGTGFFTPLYHIASVFIEPKTMMTSMQHGMADSTFYFVLGPAVLGAVIHMMVGAMYGAMFGIVLTFVRSSGPALVAVGAVFGAMVFVVSSWVGLPIAAAIFNSGDQITDMAKMVGYGTFLVEHVMFGLALGLLYLNRRVSASR